jgi:hypothetical protein
MSTIHKNLTGADLHEPKGADTALAGRVYVSDGAGSGSWVDATSVITNSAWSTGDIKTTHKVAADTSWILWSDGTIGDASSSATIRANADTAALFALYWNNYSNSLCPVSGGRGASAAADYAAHKTLALPLGAGRALSNSGTGSGLTARTVGTWSGNETITLGTANLPNVTFAVTVTGTITVVSTGANILQGSVANPFINFDTNNQPGSLIGTGAAAGAITSTGGATLTGGTSSLNGGVTQTAFSITQPTTYVNIMIKL